MLLPRNHTPPAKFLMAAGAFHVVATLWLLYSWFAAGTRLGVLLQPEIVEFVGVGACMLFKLGCLRARWWLMVFEATGEAERVATFAFTHHTIGIIWSFDKEITLLLWTPLHTFTLISELLAMPGKILIQQNFVILEILQKKGMGHNYVTLALRTLSENTGSAVAFNFVL